MFPLQSCWKASNDACQNCRPIEVDDRPSGRISRTVADNDGVTFYDERELDQGDVIACGTTDIEGYGATLLARAPFITDAIRIHLARQACTHHHDDLASIQALLGTPARWCLACGTRLHAR